MPQGPDSEHAADDDPPVERCAERQLIQSHVSWACDIAPTVGWPAQYMIGESRDTFFSKIFTNIQ